MSRLLFCTAKIVNVDKNAESKDEMRKKQTGLLKQRMLRKSCFFPLKFSGCRNDQSQKQDVKKCCHKKTSPFKFIIFLYFNLVMRKFFED